MIVKMPWLWMQRIDGVPGGGILTIDTLQNVLIRYYSSQGFPQHPMDVPRMMRSCENLDVAPTGRCWNCVHADYESECGNHSLPAKIYDWSGEEGGAITCPFWEERRYVVN